MTCPKHLHGKKASNNNNKLAVFSAMLEQELQYRSVHYLNNAVVTRAKAAHRSRVCRWIFDTISCARLSRETAVVAISYLDRFLSCSCSSSSSSPRAKKALMDRKEYQLVAMTCLYLAIKIHEPKMMDAETISSLSRGVHTGQDILARERELLTSLRCKVNDVTPLHFTSRMLNLLPQDLPESRKKALHELCEASLQEQILLAIEDYGFVIVRRSSIAIAAMINSLKNVPQDILSSHEKKQYLQVLSDAFGFNIAKSPLINAVASRLWLNMNKSSPPSSYSSSRSINGKESSTPQPNQVINDASSVVCTSKAA